MESVTLILSKSQQSFIATKCPTIASATYWERWQQEQYWWSITNPDGTPRPAYTALKAFFATGV